MAEDLPNEILERLEQIEARLDRLEGTRTPPPPPTYSPPPPRAVDGPAPPPIYSPPFASLTATGHAAPVKQDADYEIGARWLPRIGGGVMVLAIGYFAHWAERQGLITPLMQFIAALGVCLAFIVVGLSRLSTREDFGKILLGIGLGGLYLTIGGGHLTWNLYAGEPMVASFIVLSLANLAVALRLASPALLALGFAGGLAGALMPLDKAAYALSSSLILLVSLVALGVAGKHRWSSAVGSVWLLSALPLVPCLFSTTFDPWRAVAILLVHASAAMLASAAAWKRTAFEPVPALIPTIAIVTAVSAQFLVLLESNVRPPAEVVSLAAIAVAALTLGLSFLAREEVRSAFHSGAAVAALLVSPWAFEPGPRLVIQLVVSFALVVLSSKAYAKPSLLLAALSTLCATVSWYERPSLPAAPELVATGALVLAAYAVAYALSRQPEPEWGQLAMIGSTILALYVTFDAAWAWGAFIESEKFAAATLAWIVTFSLLLIAGSLLRSVELRISGLVILGAAFAKVMLVDLAELDQILRMVVLFVLGILMLGLSYLLYLRPMQRRARTQETVEPAGPST